MHMIRNAADTVTFTIGVTGNRGEISMERGTDGGIKNGRAFFGAKDNVDEEE